MSITMIEIQQQPVAERVLTIQRLAYRIEADIIGFEGIPQLHETLADLQASPELFLGYLVDDGVAGVLSYSMEGNTLDIGRLVVHPDFFRRGIARQLLHHLEHLPGITRMIVSTGAKNTPACKLYEKQGYTKIGEKLITAGLVIAQFEKTLSSHDDR